MAATAASWIIVVTFTTTCLLSPAASSTTSEDSRIFCQWEYFSASCQADEVILMQSAVYGRMKVDGECAKKDYGHIGCHVDVMLYMDDMCTGRRSCNFEIYSSDLRQLSVCPVEIASFLEARYTCLPVATSNPDQCVQQHHLTLSRPVGYIASMESEEHRLGTAVCPWQIQAGSGQTISLYLLKYTVPHEHRDSSQSSCYELAEVTEADDSRRIVTTCDSPANVLYQSKSTTVRVQLVNPQTLATLGKFVLKYKVMGCEDIKPPPNTTWHRKGQNLTVKCNNMDKTWYFVCEGNEWQVPRDEINCIPEHGESGGLGRILHDSEFPYGILIVVAIGVALGIFCGGLLLTCAYMYMKKRRRAQRTASGSGREADERFIVQEDTFPPPPDELLHHHPLTTYTDVHVKGHEDCLLHGQCTDTDKQQLALVYTKTKINPGMRTINGKHFYETPRFV